MRKQMKIAAVVSATALLAIGASFTSMAAAKTGNWVQEDGTWFAYDKNGKMIRHIIRERIDDKTAQLLIDFLAGETKWKNSTDIKFYTSNSSTLPSPKLLD